MRLQQKSTETAHRNDVKCRVRGEGRMESASPSPEPRHVCPGSLVKWKPRRWVWNPGPHRALSEDWGPACSPVSPATPVAPPSLGTSQRPAPQWHLWCGDCTWPLWGLNHQGKNSLPVDGSQPCWVGHPSGRALSPSASASQPSGPSWPVCRLLGRRNPLLTRVGVTCAPPGGALVEKN